MVSRALKPNISVVAPTRGRVSQLKAMLESLFETAQQPDRVEVVLRCDNDDTETIDFLCTGDASFIVGSRLNGYATLATLINEAARMSRAELVLVVNDDAKFVTKGWEMKLVAAAYRYPDGLFDLGVSTLNEGNFVFPCVSRRQIDLLGCVYDERLVYTDIWLRDALMPFERAVHVPEVRIEHQWQGMTEDQRRAVRNTNTSEYEGLYARCVSEASEKIRKALRC